MPSLSWSQVVGGTAWFWTRPDVAGAVDVLEICLPLTRDVLIDHAAP